MGRSMTPRSSGGQPQTAAMQRGQVAECLQDVGHEDEAVVRGHLRVVYYGVGAASA